MTDLSDERLAEIERDNLFTYGEVASIISELRRLRAEKAVETLYRDLNGLDIANLEKRADWCMEQMFEGMLGLNKQARHYLVEHFRAVRAEKAESGWRELEAVVSVARRMPRATPGPGGNSTIHQFGIAAGTVWELDAALTALDALPSSPPTPTFPQARRVSDDRH